MNQEDIPVYYDCSVFPDELSSGKAMHYLNDFIFAHGYTLSVYRFQLNGVLHVLVLGECPSQEVRERMHRILAKGRIVQMSHEALIEFLKRSIEKWEEGDQEHHYGKPQ